MPNVYTENWVIFLRVRALQIPILYTGKLRQTVRWLSQNYKGSQPFQRLTKFQLNHCGCFCICWASSLTAAPGVENAPFCSMKVINWVKARKSVTACAENPKCIYMKGLSPSPKGKEPPSSVGGSTLAGTCNRREESSTHSLLNLNLEQIVRQTLTYNCPFLAWWSHLPAADVKKRRLFDCLVFRHIS